MQRGHGLWSERVDTGLSWCMFWWTLVRIRVQRADRNWSIGKDRYSQLDANH